MSISQQVVTQPGSGNIKYVDGPPGMGSDGSGMPPGGGNGSTPPAGGGGDGSGGSTPPVGGGGDGGGGSTPPVSGGGDGGDGSTPPVSGGGDGGGGSTPPVSGGGDGGDGSTPPVSGGGDGGDGSTPPVSGGGDGGDGSPPPVGGGGDGGDGSTPPVGGGGDGGTTPPTGDTGGLTIGIDPLLTVGLGGTDGSGLSVNVLTPPDATDSHGVNVNVGSNGDGSNLLDIGLLPTTGGLGLPGTGEPGSGNPLDLGSLLSVTPSGADGQGLSVNALTGPDATDTHGLNVNLLDTGDGHNLLDVGLLPSTGLGLPGAGDGGTGNPLDLGSLLSITPSGADGQGLSVNALTGPDATDNHGLNVNLLDTGDGHNLLDVGLLPNTGLGLPGTGDGGSGNPLDLGSLLSVTPSGSDGNGLSINALTGADASDTNGLNVNVLDTGDGHNLIDVGLPNTGLGLPGSGDAGSGNPLGNLLDSNGLVSAVLGDEGGLLNGTVGNLNGSSTGHLVDLDVGPEASNGLGLDLLSTPGTDPAHAVSVNAVDVGPEGPQLLDLGALTGSSGILDVPSLGGTGTDGLAGNLLGTDGLLGGLLGGAGLGGGVLNGDIASGNTVSAPITAPLDVTALTDTVTAPLTGDHGLLDLHGAHIV